MIDKRQAAFLVLGCEVYGRWCPDALSLVKELAYLKARSSPAYLRASVRAACARISITDPGPIGDATRVYTLV